MAIELESIQNTIGYKFKNLDLLQQAFVRKSYSEEHGGQNNEVLEFIGDKALDLAVIKIMMDYFGEITNSKQYQELKLKNPKYFTTKLNEGQFTDIKKDLVQKKALSKCMDKLGFQTQLIMGRGDINENAQEQDSVKEDLFEAIVGAVAVDSYWNMEIICDVVENMIDFDDYFSHLDNVEEDYVIEVQQWSQSHGFGLPFYEFEEIEDGFLCSVSIEEIGLQENGFGTSKSKARANAARLAYEWLDDNQYLIHDLFDIVGEPDEIEALRQLNELVQQGAIEEPDFKYSQDYDDNGNPVWFCDLNFDDEYWGHFDCSTVSTSKKETKRQAVYELLCYLENCIAKKYNNR